MKDKDNKPNVSVITVCLNPGKSLVKTIDSVLAQDYNDFEYIITDGTSELIDEYR